MPGTAYCIGVVVKQSDWLECCCTTKGGQVIAKCPVMSYIPVFNVLFATVHHPGNQLAAIHGHDNVHGRADDWNWKSSGDARHLCALDCSRDLLVKSQL